MPNKKDETTWTHRDELAAQFLAAQITGIFASGRGIGSDGTPEAFTAYKFADAFLAVRSKVPKA